MVQNFLSTVAATHYLLNVEARMKNSALNNFGKWISVVCGGEDDGSPSSKCSVSDCHSSDVGDIEAFSGVKHPRYFSVS